MNNSFLHQAAQQILADHPNDLHRVLILLPNKRGEIFLKRELGKLLKKPVLAPAMQTIEEFVQELSGYQKRSQLQLLITLYGVYRTQVNPEETFDNFIKWGNTLLHDFNEIDRHLIDAQQLFGNLLDAKKIESWGVEPGNESELMRNFLRFWADLYPLYNAFHAALDAENASYQGRAYRKVAAQLSLVDDALGDNYTGIYLLGFNALNTAEERIFRHLIGSHNATALWDADRYYTDDEQHEAGLFLRKYQQWPEHVNRPMQWLQTYLEEHPKRIQVISAPSKQGMAQAAGRVLQTLPADEAADTAVVLADEALLMPMLDAIPAGYEALNVTMGLPIKNTAIAQDLRTLLRMHEQAERTQLSSNTYSYHHHTFLAAVETKVFRALAQPGQISALTAHVIAKNMVFISPKRAEELANDFGFPRVLSKLFAEPTSATALLTALDHVLKSYVAANQEGDALLREASFALHALHVQATNLLQNLGEAIQTTTLLRLYQTILAEHQIDFFGEPLLGLQVMGMLETRTLDFRRVIITSMNEGVLPAGKSQNSFIPHDLKRGFGMPSHHEKDAVYAYHFYRLLQRAEEVWLIYDSDTRGVGVKEKSRFIFQLENELKHASNVTMPDTFHLVPEVKPESLLRAATYAKDQLAIERLREMAIKGFSPSALSTYIKDPVQFYAERMLRVKEADEVAETIGYDVLGNVVHKSLEELYKRVEQKPIKKETLEQMRKEAPEVVKAQLESEYSGTITEGRNLLTSKVALHMVTTAIEQDQNRLEECEQNNALLTLIGLEQELHTTEEIQGLDFPVRFYGFADRIDRIGNAIYILDYKTGYIEPKELKVADVASIFENPDNTKAFQVLFYAWVYAKKAGVPKEGLTAGIFSTRSPSNKFMSLSINSNTSITLEVLEVFQERLFKMIQELFDATIPFAQRLTTIKDS